MEKEIEKSKVIAIYASCLSIFGIIGYIIFSNVFENLNITVLLSFALNIFLWSVLFVKEIIQKSYSMKMIFSFFGIFFYGIAALIQYTNHRFPWIGSRSDNTLFLANVLLTLYTACFILGSMHNFGKGTGKLTLFLRKDYLPSSVGIRGLTIFNIICVVYRVIIIGPTNLFNKSSISEEINYGTNSSFALLISHVLVALCCMTVLYSVSAAKKYGSFKKHAIINIICLLISYFPTNLSRYTTAAVYGSLLLVAFPKLKRKRIFIVGFTMAFLVVFPLLNDYRRSDIGDVDALTSLMSAIKSIPNCWTEGHYDSYTTYTLTLDEVSKYGMTYGRQLLGVVLFFVPRTIWDEKPIGSGAFMAEKIGSFTNISCSFPGEGYINFGVVGIIAFGLLIGFVTSYLDNVYWNNEQPNSIRITTIYPVLLMMLFFILRGDLMSSYAYTFAFVFTWLIVDRICFPNVKNEVEL